MDSLLPWKELSSPIGRYYSKSLTDRNPYPSSAMQFFYNLSDTAMQDMLYEVETSAVLRALVLIRFRMRQQYSDYVIYWCSTVWR